MTDATTTEADVDARRLLSLFAPLVLAACGGGDNDYGYGPTISGPYANIQVLNASPDAPPLSVQIDGQTLVPYLDYGQGTGEQSISATSHTLTVQALTPGAPTTLFAEELALPVVANTDYVVAVEGPVDNSVAISFTHALAVVPASSTRVQVLNADPDAHDIAIFVTAPGADLGSSTPLGTSYPQGSVGPVTLDAGAYEIRITAAGTVTPVLYDSGPLELLGGTDLVIAALENTGPGTSPFTLASVDALGNRAWLPDVNAPAALRVVHDSANAPPLSVLLNGDVSAPLVASIAFANATAYLNLTSAVDVLALTPASNPNQTLVAQSLQLEGGTSHTLYALAPLAQIGEWVTRDDTRRYATQAKLRIIQGSPGANLVDIYVLPSGTALSAATSPTYAGVTFGGDTGFVSYAAGSYSITLTSAGTQNVLLGPTAVTLKNDGLYTTVARDAAGGGAPYGWILLDDLAP